MKAKKARTIKKTLQITVLCLFAAAFLLPKGGKSYLMTGIAAAGVIVSRSGSTRTQDQPLAYPGMRICRLSVSTQRQSASEDAGFRTHP